ncbi:hypothetical protein ACFY0F_10755 [Streptomyces sp. NPDC001544]|uniref:hypothetical protein n=1 Tax=Streptomyces sp. NPDC001544 TaxID=3364584 RepID=UPI0036A0E35D
MALVEVGGLRRYGRAHGSPSRTRPFHTPLAVDRGTRWPGIALIGCGLAMLPWLLVLGAALPATPRVPHWSAAWVGLDALEALGLTATGVLLLRRNPRRALAAAATAALLIVDAWFDIVTSAPGAELAAAIAMAAVAELPMAAVCVVLATASCRPGFPGRDRPPHHRRPDVTAGAATTPPPTPLEETTMTERPPKPTEHPEPAERPEGHSENAIVDLFVERFGDRIDDRVAASFDEVCAERLAEPGPLQRAVARDRRADLRVLLLSLILGTVATTFAPGGTTALLISWAGLVVLNLAYLFRPR